MLEIRKKLLLENSGLERHRKYEQREHNPRNSVCAKFRLSPPVFLWTGGGINYICKKHICQREELGQSSGVQTGLRRRKKTGGMWDKALDTAECRVYTLWEMLARGCSETETGKSLVLQNLQVPMSVAGRCISKKSERLRARAWGKDDGQQREW